MSSDGKTCVTACKTGEYVGDKQEGKSYSMCLVACDKHKFTDKKGILRCSKYCIVEQVENKDKSCINKTACTGVVSVDGKYCLDSCDKTKFEYSQTIKGFKQCFVCDNFFKIKNSVGVCDKKCEKNESEIISKH